MEVTEKFNLTLIEDAAESIGSYYRNQHTGTFGLFGTLSFNGNKTITTGGGGAILTNNAEAAKRAKHLSTTAKIPHKWEFKHDEIGFNYRMPNINAALGCAQLEQLPQKLLYKRELFEKYKSELSDINGISIFKEPKNCQSNYWLQTLILDTPNLELRDELLEVLNYHGYMSRPAWNLINTLDSYTHLPSMELEVSKNLFESIINIPSSATLELIK
jgi:dTDP-4-amino-4,6-dideoxygalactose transaminase